MTHVPGDVLNVTIAGLEPLSVTISQNDAAFRK
jgi:protein involved in polysaccharide export with SLBB domain